MKKKNPIFVSLIVFLCFNFFIVGNQEAKANMQWRSVVLDGFGTGVTTIQKMKAFKESLYAAGYDGLKTQLWKTSDGENWEFIDLEPLWNNVVKSLEVFNGFLYAGVNRASGAQLWRSSDGLNWDLIIDNGFDASNIGFYSMIEFNNYFYIGTWSLSGGQVWRSSDAISWEKVTTNGFGTGNYAICAFTIFNGYLYAGTNKWTTGCEVWRTSDGLSWERVAQNGFGNSEYNDVVTSLAVFNDHIFAGTQTYIRGFEVWKSNDGVNWIKAAPDGFGDPVNTLAVNTWCEFKNHQNGLYAITAVSGNIQGGAQVWRTLESLAWERVSDYGFGKSENFRFLAVEEFKGFLFVGTQNDVSGSEIWTNMPSVKKIEIDIKPGSFPNSINPRSNGVIPMAILTTDEFDGMTVDPNSLLFGRTGTEASPKHYAFEDVDGDGDIDMILHFKTKETLIQCGDTEAKLTGQTLDGLKIYGLDSVRTVGCK